MEGRKGIQIRNNNQLTVHWLSVLRGMMELYDEGKELFWWSRTRRVSKE
jgi:hypothetical protein